MRFASLLILALLAAPASADTFVNGVPFEPAAPAPIPLAYQSADPAVITEVELLASTPRRTVTRTVTTATGWTSASPVAIMAAACAPASASASACGSSTVRATSASACSSSSSRTVTRSRSFAPVRRLFGVRLRGGC